VFAVYSTFLQRAIDQLIVNNALMNLDVVFAIDRAGLVGADGPTHHGMFDLVYTRMVPNMRVLAPSNEAELVNSLHTALVLGGPFAVRYPRGEACGVPIPDGMKEHQKFPHPIVTPTTKAEIGEHDQNISKEEIIRSGLVSKEDYEKLEKYALELFARGTEIAAKQGLILVDTKYEFGKKDGEILLMDEIHTPDSSRYFYADGYQERFDKGEAQRQLSKEFVREWLMEHGFQGRPGEQVPEMTDEFVTSVSDRYIELYEHITGEKFVKDDTDDILDRIENNTKNMLARLK